MSGNKLLLDTNAILGFLTDARYKSAFDKKSLFVSTITELELLSFHSLRDDELEKINIFFGFCEIIELTPSIKSKGQATKTACFSGAVKQPRTYLHFPYAYAP